MDMTQQTNDNWLLSNIFNALRLDNLPSLSSAFETADSYLDSAFEYVETGFRFFGFEELANQIENMQTGNWLARQFGLEAKIDAAPTIEDTGLEAATPRATTVNPALQP